MKGTFFDHQNEADNLFRQRAICVPFYFSHLILFTFKLKNALRETRANKPHGDRFKNGKLAIKLNS